MSAPVTECPICMDTIEGLCNRVITECGHSFHCSCLMQNAAHNGFGCPYCRTKMAEEPEQEEYDDEYSDAEDATVFDEEALTSFRMFHQRLNGEEVEEEEEEDWATVDGDEGEEEDAEEENSQQIPDASYISQKLSERGITLEDLVKNILYQEHSHFGTNYTDYERRSSEVYGQFRAVISQYRVPSNPPPVVINPVSNSSETQVVLPEIAESKTSGNYRRREMISHI